MNCAYRRTYRQAGSGDRQEGSDDAERLGSVPEVRAGGGKIRWAGSERFALRSHRLRRVSTMSPDVRGPLPPATSDLRRVSRNPQNFHTGRWFLLAQGLVLCALGITGFISAATHPEAGAFGAPVLMLALTPWHSALLLGFGVAGLVGALQRHAAVVITAVGAVVFVALVFVGAVAAAHHAPGVLGFEASDIVLHGFLTATNIGLLYWLLPDVLEGKDWVPRRVPADRGAGGEHRDG